MIAALILPGCIVVPTRSYQPVYSPSPVTDNYAAPPSPPQVVYQPPPPEVAPVYQDELAPYGRWIVYPQYGRCWSPASVPNGWQPYTVGHWVYTSDGSCCWVSEDNEVAWGPTVYHYGQWAFTPDYGWIWVPGTTWSPAWVSWREGDGYCGWSPLPPEACYQNQVTYVVADQYCPPDRYVYVQEGDVNVVHVDRHFVRNTTIIRNTTNITNITVVNNRVINGGVSTDHVQRYSGRPVQRTAVVEANSPEQARDLVSRGEAVHYSTAAINQQIEAQAHRQTQLQNQLQHDQQIGDQRKLQLDSQVQTDRQLKQDQQAAHQQQVQLDQQIAQQKQVDREKEIELKNQAAQDKQIAHQQEVEQARQAERDKAAQHTREVEAQQQAARDKAAQHAQDVEAQKQGERERQAQQQQQAEQDKHNAHDGAGQPPARAKPKPRPDQPPDATPPP